MEFLKVKYRTSDIFLSELNFKSITDFEYFLRISNPFELKIPMGNNTVMKHLERLRKIVNMAIRFEWITKDPFAAFKPRFNKVERGYLTESELQKLEDIEFKSDRLSYVKDLFVFSCYTGLAYIDTMQLTPDNIHIGIDREYWIYTKRKKTDTTVKIPLLPKALEKVEKYKTNPGSISGGTISPKISNQKANDYLKEIADLASVDKNLTFHVARYVILSLCLKTSMLQRDF